MRFEELLQDERAAGKVEGKAEGKAEAILERLQIFGEVPEELKERILSEKDLERLSCWNKLTARVDSVEAFVAGMDG